MRAYSKSYLNDAAGSFGSMMDYAINSCGLNGDRFLHMFTVSGMAEQFEHGNPRLLSGMSGAELAMKTIAGVTGETPTAPPPEHTAFRTPEYWAGWALCQYQWYCAHSFAAILRGFPFAEILSTYHPLHEADISKFFEVAEQRYISRNPQTNLGRLRKEYGLSQSQLASRSDVSLRSIQMYEQRNKDINKAGAITVAKLARALSCRMEDLLESE